MRGNFFSRLTASGAALILALVSPLAAQQIDPAAGLSGELRSQYLQTLEDPYDLETLLRVAGQFEQSGDRDTAIRLYERALIVDPKLHSVRLRVAYLEARLGNSIGALGHLSRLEDAELSPAETNARNRLIKEFEDETKEHSVRWRAEAGLVYRTNANAAPDRNILILGSPGVQVSGSDPAESGGIYANFDLNHRYDPGRQDAVVWDTHLAFFGEKLFQESDFDFGFLALRTGPVFPRDPSQPKVSYFQPFGEIELISFDKEFYSATPYAGVQLVTEMTPATMVTTTGRVGWRLHGPGADVTFANRQDPIDIVPGENVDLPVRLARDRDGLVIAISSNVSVLHSPDLVLYGGPLAMIDDAKDDAASFGRIGVQLGATWFFDNAPLRGPPAELSLSLLYLHDRYFEAETQVTADPALSVDPSGFRKRKDNLLGLGLGGKFPLDDDLSITASLGWTKVFSNIDNFTYDDVAGKLGVEFEF